MIIVLPTFTSYAVQISTVTRFTCELEPALAFSAKPTYDRFQARIIIRLTIRVFIIVDCIHVRVILHYCDQLQKGGRRCHEGLLSFPPDEFIDDWLHCQCSPAAVQ